MCCIPGNHHHHHHHHGTWPSVGVSEYILRMGSCLCRFCGINPKTIPFGVEQSARLLVSVINPKSIPFGVEQSVHLLVSSRPGSEFARTSRCCDYRIGTGTDTGTESLVSNASVKIQSEQQICACSSQARQVSPRYPPL